MKNMEREKFEESWKDAFDKAEVTPSEGVWTNIELDLEKAKGGNLKKRLMFFQMVAAASVVFAMAIGGAGYYFNVKMNQTFPNQIALEQESSSIQEHPVEPRSISDEAASGNETAASQDTENSAAPRVNETPGSTKQLHSQSIRPISEGYGKRSAAGKSESRAAQGHQSREFHDNSSAPGFTDAQTEANRELIAAKQADQFPELPRDIDERSVTPLYTPREIALIIPNEKKKVDPVVAMLAMLEQREREVQIEKDERISSVSDENLWTSIGFSAGSFNSVQGSVASRPSATMSNYSSAMALAAPILDQETKASGYSYSMGVNVGTRISERWVLQGGLNYLTQASEYTANNVVVSSGLPQQQRFRAATSNEVLSVDNLGSKLAYSAPYTVNNSMRYLSIPMQAGYLLVNKTFGLQLNAGVATDLFLQNTIKADNDQLDRTSQPSGSDSPYRAVNLSGLLGTEVSYRFGENYRISLNPGIRYPFNTIYKTELGVSSTPLTFDIGLRFRYIFH